MIPLACHHPLRCQLGRPISSSRNWDDHFTMESHGDDWGKPPILYRNHHLYPLNVTILYPFYSHLYPLITKKTCHRKPPYRDYLGFLGGEQWAQRLGLLAKLRQPLFQKDPWRAADRITKRVTELQQFGSFESEKIAVTGSLQQLKCCKISVEHIVSDNM